MTSKMRRPAPEWQSQPALTSSLPSLRVCRLQALQELFASFEADALVFVGGLGDDSHRTSVKCHGTDDVDVLALALHVLRCSAENQWGLGPGH